MTDIGKNLSDKFPDFKIVKLNKDERAKLAILAEKLRIALWQDAEDDRNRNKQLPDDWRGRIIRQM